MLEDILVPIAICVALPVLIVWLIGRVRQNEVNRKTEVMLKAIESGAEINPDLLQRAKKPKSLKERLLGRLTAAIICTLIGVSILLTGLLTPMIEGFENAQARIVLGFLVDIPGLIFISVGIGLFVYYFAGKKMLAKELEAE